MEMEKENVVEILKFYKNIEDEIELNRRVIQNLDERYYSSVGAINMDGMPKGKGGTSSSVESVALNVPSSVSKTIRELEEENNQLYKLKVEIFKEVNKLPYIYKKIIFDFYINNLQWVRISEQIHYSERQCKNIRNRGLEKLSKLFSVNKVISNFAIPQ